MSQNDNVNANDLSGSRHIQFGEFTGLSNPQNAPIGANPAAGTPAFNNVSGPGFPGPFGDGSHPSPVNNQNTPFGAITHAGASAFPVPTGPGFTGPTGGGSQSGFFPNTNPQFGHAPNFGSPFHGVNNYVALGTSYPFHQHMQTMTLFANYGYPTPMMNAQGMSSSVPTTPLRITVGNLITHSDNCAMCMGYGATAPSTNNQGHELVVNSLQEQLASTLRSHETKRQTLTDRITALELERNELCTRHESDMAQLDEISRDCQEANKRRLYWKDQYYDLRDHGDREVPMVPLQSRIASLEHRVASGPSIPLSQRLTPTEGDTNTQRNIEVKRSVRPEPAQGRVEEASAEPQASSSTHITPHMGEKRKREAAGQSSGQRALVSYDDLRDNSEEPTYSFKAYQMEHYLTDMEDDYSEPEAHPNQLKGKQRELQNKTN
ncbi:hypothetical protein F5890DRAFT_1560217 [Lentinula detonsa]|uniref:Uncharacterized protein n=1 Tax=Lentinula detonsa TaxID=2804962 RepID=A0AA38PMU5_9AGAR|nr:hypothetical protein F5890DRAFT_1560217 [Lentinula detonsa]